MRLHNLMGMRVIVNPHLPRKQNVKIGSDFEWITPECRGRVNAWLLQAFGDSDQCLMIDNDLLVMSPAGFAALRKGSAPPTLLQGE